MASHDLGNTSTQFSEQLPERFPELMGAHMKNVHLPLHSRSFFFGGGGGLRAQEKNSMSLIRLCCFFFSFLFLPSLLIILFFSCFFSALSPFKLCIFSCYSCLGQLSLTGFLMLSVTLSGLDAHIVIVQSRGNQSNICIVGL